MAGGGSRMPPPPNVLGKLLLPLLAAASRGALHGPRSRRVIGLGASVRRHRVADRLADERAGFGERQLADTFGPDHVAVFAHVLDLIAEKVGTERDLDEALVAVAINDLTDFAQLRLGRLDLLVQFAVEVPVAGLEALADAVEQLSHVSIADGGLQTLFATDLVHVCNRHGLSLL